MDGVTKSKIKDVDSFIEGVRLELKSGTFKPLAVKEVLIPKPKGGETTVRHSRSEG